jgi:hypothetical protein
MLPASLAHALDFFETRAPSEISREAVTAYATLRAIAHYYPDRLTDPMRRMLENYAWIKEQEPARAIKQKRIMSWILSRELETVSNPGTD